MEFSVTATRLRDVVDLQDGSELSDEDRKENRKSMDNRRINYFLPFS